MLFSRVWTKACISIRSLPKRKEGASPNQRAQQNYRKLTLHYCCSCCRIQKLVLPNQASSEAVLCKARVLSSAQYKVLRKPNRLQQQPARSSPMCQGTPIWQAVNNSLQKYVERNYKHWSLWTLSGLCPASWSTPRMSNFLVLSGSNISRVGPSLSSTDVNWLLTSHEESLQAGQRWELHSLALFCEAVCFFTRLEKHQVVAMQA